MKDKNRDNGKKDNQEGTNEEEINEEGTNEEEINEERTNKEVTSEGIVSEDANSKETEKVPSRLRLRQMTREDVDGVLAIEQASFTTPWSRGAFIKEVTENHLAYYTVAEIDGEIAGYAGVWLIMDEGHITNIAVDPKYRGQQIGKKILKKLIKELKSRKILRVTLEVRESNEVAINLYKSFGFITLGRRPGYYTDNGEDALIMWKDISREI